MEKWVQNEDEIKRWHEHDTNRNNQLNRENGRQSYNELKQKLKDAEIVREWLKQHGCKTDISKNASHIKDFKLLIETIDQHSIFNFNLPYQKVLRFFACYLLIELHKIYFKDTDALDMTLKNFAYSLLNWPSDHDKLTEALEKLTSPFNSSCTNHDDMRKEAADKIYKGYCDLDLHPKVIRKDGGLLKTSLSGPTFAEWWKKENADPNFKSEKIDQDSLKITHNSLEIEQNSFAGPIVQIRIPHNKRRPSRSSIYYTFSGFRYTLEFNTRALFPKYKKK